MSFGTSRVPYAALLALAILTTGPQPTASGQDTDQLDKQFDAASGQDTDQLDKQFDAAWEDGRLGDAERVARQAAAVVTASGDAKSLAYWRSKLGKVLANLQRFDEAETLLKQAVAFYEKAGDGERSNAGVCLDMLGTMYCSTSRFAEAEPLAKRALAIAQDLLGVDHNFVAPRLNHLADIYVAQGRYAEAEPLRKRALAIREKANDTYGVAACLAGLAELSLEQGHFDEAEGRIKRSLAIREKAATPSELSGLAADLNILGRVCAERGWYAEAEAVHKRALAIGEKVSGPDDLGVTSTRRFLARVYQKQGRFAEAELIQKRVLAIVEKAFGPDNMQVAWSLAHLAGVVSDLGRYHEVEPLLKRALAIEEKTFGPDNIEMAWTLNGLGNLYSSLGRHADAEAMYKRTLAIWEKALRPDHPHLAGALGNLASTYSAQGRNAEAEPLYKRVLAIEEKTFGPDNINMTRTVGNLGLMYHEQGRNADAELLLKRALAIEEKSLGAGHPHVAASLINLSTLYDSQGRFAEAEALLKRALAIQEKALGPDHPQAAFTLNNLAYYYTKHGRDTEAEPLFDRAIAINERAGANPHLLFKSYHLRAQLAWRANRRGEALADLRHALDLAEQQRRQASGGERERADSFGRYARAFERMVAWQAELGDPGEAFNAIERTHARSLLDQIAAAGSDPQIGRPAPERERLRRQEGELRSKVAELEKHGEILLKTKKPDSDEAKALDADLAAARTALYEHLRDARSSSPVYRGLLSTGSGPPRLSQIQRRLTPHSLLLVYLFGAEGGYVLVVGPGPARVVTLTLAKAEAETLGVDAGPLTLGRLQAALVGETNDGVVPQLADKARADKIPAKLAALWRVLVPEGDRRSILDGTVKTLFVIPDGPLAVLPFESLVVEDGPEPKYLLDVGPPVSYAPSATILYNLSGRPTSQPQPGREPVLTLGDPAYPGADAPGQPTATALLEARSRFRSAGGRLPRLPFTGWETSWVAKAFADKGAMVVTLTGPSATEAKVRANTPGRRVIHLACHGLTDPANANFFAALAFTPGPKGAADPADDGFLTLPEVYELDLKGCELAVLSACETNFFGLRQRGEGTWAISNGFLVAGSRRVVASNWLVDDEAAASLVSVFCTGLARAEGGGGPADYAEALRSAKRWARGQDKWKSPYYWASLVLVGPP